MRGKTKNLSFQDLIFMLKKYWAKQSCLIVENYDLPMGAGSFHPATALRILREKNWRAAYLQACRRPNDGRYGKNPFRLSHYYQFQVIMKPIPEPQKILEIYCHSLSQMGINPQLHDLKFIEDDWESPTLGASGMGWEVQCDGCEITQFTYFQKMASIPCLALEITYGLERIAMFLQQKNNVFDIIWSDDNNLKVTYADLFLENETQQSQYNFGDIRPQPDFDPEEFLLEQFTQTEKLCACLLKQKNPIPIPAWEQVVNASHIFNLLDARNKISVQQRQIFIKRIRNLARKTAETYIKLNM